MQVNLLKLYDSRGTPTVCAYLKYKNKIIKAIAPAGKSTGSHEVVSYPLIKGLPNIDLSFKFFKKNRKTIEQGFDFDNQEEFDSLLEELDETPRFENFGGNLTIALSMLFLKYSAVKNNLQLYEYLNPKAKLKDLPKPFGNSFGGGLHSDDNIPVQEFLVLNEKRLVSDNIRLNIEVYNKIKEQLRKNKIFFGKNDEGALEAKLSFNKAIEFMENAIDEVGEKSKYGLDVAANSFYNKGVYNFEDKKYSEKEFVSFWDSFLKKHKRIVFLEDPFFEESFDAFANLQKKTKSMICGDDLYTTNKDRLTIGIKKKATKAILIKPNQIGTISRMRETVELAKKNNLVTVISHRSGETTDATIAHLAVGLKIPYIKTGTVSGERLAKLNELILIERLIS